MISTSKIRKLRRLGADQTKVYFMDTTPETLRRISKLLGVGFRDSSDNYTWDKWIIGGDDVIAFHATTTPTETPF